MAGRVGEKWVDWERECSEQASKQAGRRGRWLMGSLSIIDHHPRGMASIDNTTEPPSTPFPLNYPIHTHPSLQLTWPPPMKRKRG